MVSQTVVIFDYNDVVRSEKPNAHTHTKTKLAPELHLSLQDSNSFKANRSQYVKAKSSVLIRIKLITPTVLRDKLSSLWFQVGPLGEKRAFTCQNLVEHIKTFFKVHVYYSCPRLPPCATPLFSLTCGPALPDPSPSVRTPPGFLAWRYVRAFASRD